MITAPIVLFVYNRPWHTQQTIEALQKNTLSNESELFIYSDAPKNESDKEKVQAVRERIHSVEGFKKVTIIEREKNWGLADSIIDGATEIVNKYGKIIVLEDDLVTSPVFLEYMNDALVKYKNERSVFSITGYSHSNDIENIDATYFLKLTSSWSWATWKEKWASFSRESGLLESCLKNKKHFDYDNSYPYSEMVALQLKGEINSWAIYWYASTFKKEGLTLYPAKSLVNNIGFDGSGTHCLAIERQEKANSFCYQLTDDIDEKDNIRALIANKLKEQGHVSAWKKLKIILKKILPQQYQRSLFFVLSKLKLFFHKKDIGKNTYIDSTVNVFGWSHISIGDNTLVGEQSWLNINEREEGFKHIVIGNYCYIGRRNLLSSSRQLILSDYVMTNNECKFLGSNHVFDNPETPYIATGTTSDGIQKIGVNVWVGAGVIVLGNVSIGHGSIIGAGSVVTKDIPPFSIAVGNPCKVIKRYDYKKNKWVRLDVFDSSVEALMPTEEAYLEILQSNSPNIAMPKLAATSRYGDLY